MKMVQQYEQSLSFRKSIFVLTCLCALSYPNYIHPVSECDNQAAGSCEDLSHLDLGEKKQLVEKLDERTLEAFPVERAGHIEWIDIAEEIGNNQSAEFGVQLLGMKRVEMIFEIIQENPETATVRILGQWLNGSGREPVTFRTLINVLDEIGFSKLANEMATTCEVLKLMDVHYKPALAKEYSRQLSEKYKQDAVIDSEQWLPKRLHGRNITFVDLELREKGSNILLSDVLNKLQSGARILFVGRPGVGKSTITRHLSKTLVQVQTEQFYLVLKLHLSGRKKLDSLITLLESADESFDSNDITIISNYTERTRGEGVCFLLDGYDEYVKPPEGYDYVTSLIKGKTLNESVVMVTSRPSAIEDIEPYFDRIVEIFGFGERGIRTYLEQLDISQIENQTIHQYFDAHPDVRRLCYLPLHLTMMVYIAVDTIDTGTLSVVDTETALYTEFLYLTIKQYESVRHEQTVESLKECFDDRYIKTDLCILLQQISKKAFEGILSREQTFISSSLALDGLPDSINISAEIEALSLFKIETIYDGYKYYYSHPTFQEFLAAFYLAKFLREDQLIHVKNLWTHGMYKFFFGLIGNELSYDDETVFQTFVSFAQVYLATYWHEELYIMKCAHEIGRSSQYVTYLQAAGVITYSNSLHVHEHMYGLHDCWYIGYTLSLSPLHKLAVDDFLPLGELGLCLSFINKYFKHESQVIEGVKVTKLTLGECPNGFSGSWPLLTVNEDYIGTIEIIKFLPTFQNELTHLELAFSTFEHSASVAHLGETLKSFRKLKFLALSVDVSVIKDGHLESALKDLTHLEHLELGISDESEDDATIPENLLEFKGLKKLRGLTLYIDLENDLVDANMSTLIGGLKYLAGLENLSIHIVLYSGFKDNGATELFQGLEEVSSVNKLALHLDLCRTLALGNVTTRELPVALNNMTMLKSLSLCIDFKFSGIQGSSGVIELAEGLKTLAQVQYLDLELFWELQSNDTIDGAAIALTDGLKHLHNLSALGLDLEQNGSCSEIAPLFRSLAQLHELKLRCKSLGEKTDAVKLINGLKHLKQLRKLDMSMNIIGDDDVVSLVDALTYMNHLSTLDLSSNLIGDAGVKLLAEAIENEHLTHLQVLLLNHNEFSEAGAKILAEKVVKLSQLHTLDFGFAFQVYSARALALIHQQKAIGNLYSMTYIPDDMYVDLYFAPFVTVSICGVSLVLLCCRLLIQFNYT